jgi:acetyl esterase/lipase
LKITRRHLLPAGLLLSPKLWAASTSLDLKEVDPRYEIYQSGADELIPLWPQGVPGKREPSPKLIIEDRGGLNSAILGIGNPILQVYRPTVPNGTALLIIPGGGYRHLAIGPGLPRWFSARGVTCFNLLYRLPEDAWSMGPHVCLQDAVRAMRVMRQQADRFSLDPKRMGVHGSSAGGHVAGQLMTRFDDPRFDADDDLRAITARPDFVCLNYAVITMIEKTTHQGSRKRLLGAAPATELMQAFSIERHVREDTPITFMAHALDDKSVPIENSLMMLQALRKAGVPCELHLFEQGGHGFNLATQVPGNTGKWPQMFMDWLQSKRMLA